MLTYIRIQDFALIESLDLNLDRGLTVISGETGAGKSIILAAVGLLMGSRAAADLIRREADSALVEAQFELDAENPAASVLQEAGLWEEDGELIIQRVVSGQGKNRVRANGSLVNLSLLSGMGQGLMNICGQQAQQGLLRPEEHLVFLDAFARLEPGRKEVGRAVSAVRALDQEIEAQAKAIAERERRKEWLIATVEELEAAELSVEEEDELKAERRLLANSEKVAGLCREAFYGLYGDETGSALLTMGKVRDLLEDLSRLDERTAALGKKAEELFYLLEDLSHEVRDYKNSLVFDPARLDWVESRLASLQRLTRKHGGDAASALEALERARDELGSLKRGDKRLKELQAEREEALAKALTKALDLSAARRKAAPELAKAVEAEVAQLGMPSCRFQVEFSPPAQGALETESGPLGARGLETAEFFIAPNPGEGFRQLQRIASGGELSRILLALQSLAATQKGSATQIYDEVDAGIGGAVGDAVGRKLSALAKKSQVICITHLPQIAAWADAHFVVKKETRNGRTATALSPALDEDGRVEELARMLAGGGDEATAKRHAGQLLESARKAKHLS